MIGGLVVGSLHNFCSNCGEQLNESSNFCSKCGLAVQESSNNQNLNNLGVHIIEELSDEQLSLNSKLLLSKMSVQQQKFFAKEYKKLKRSSGVAIIYWLFLCHYIYLNRITTFIFYIITLGGLGVWHIIDFMRMKKLVEKANDNIAQQLLNDSISMKKTTKGISNNNLKKVAIAAVVIVALAAAFGNNNKKSNDDKKSSYSPPKVSSSSYSAPAASLVAPSLKALGIKDSKELDIKIVDTLVGEGMQFITAAVYLDNFNRDTMIIAVDRLIKQMSGKAHMFIFVNDSNFKILQRREMADRIVGVYVSTTGQLQLLKSDGTVIETITGFK